MAIDTSATLATLDDALTKLQDSARKTIPMFMIGILATLAAAGAALYYIITLSADARNSRRALVQSQAALVTVTKALRDANAQLGKKEKEASSAADTNAIKAAIADISAAEAKVASASTANKKAAARLDEADPSVRQAGIMARQAAASDKVTPENASELTGEFVVIPTNDGFLMLRSQPSLLGAAIRKVPSRSMLKCAQAIPNENGNLWRPCTDDQGNSGYVANKYIRQPR